MKYKMRSTVAIAAFLLSAGAQAQTKHLGLDEAVQLGVQNSKQLKISHAKLDAAIASLNETKQRRLPSASISGSYLRVTHPTISLLLPANSSSGSGSGTGTGTGDGSSNSLSSVKVDQAMYALGTVAMPIFDGFKTSAAIQSARYLKQASELDAENDRQAVVQNIIDAYSNLYKANASVDLVKENLKQAQQRSKDFANLEKNGLVARNDLLKVQLQESNIRLSLMDAESNLQIVNMNMNLLLGLQDDTQLELDSMNTLPAQDTHNLSYWEQTAWDNRSDARSLMFHEKAAQANIRSAKGSYYPSLSLTGGYVALNIPNAIRITDAWNAGVGVKYNIASLWKTGTEVKLAQAQLRETQASQEMLSDNIKVQVNQAYENYMLSLRKIDVYTEAVTQATENYRILKNKYDNSLATTTDLLDADVQQLQAKLNFAYSKADAVVAYNKLLQVTGSVTQSK